MIAHLKYFLGDFWPYLTFVFLCLILLPLFVFRIFKSNLDAKVKKILTAVVFTSLIMIIVFCAFEAYFRYVYDEPDGLGFLRTNEKWHQRHAVYNSDAFRDRDFSTQKKEGVVRIGVLGDSITFGGGIENVDDRFSNILEKKLRDTNYNVEIYNLGKPGYDTESEIKFYQDLKKYDFDIIIWQYFLNDIQPEGKSTGTQIITSSSQKTNIVRFISQRSYFADFLYWRFTSKYGNTFNQLKTADLAQYENEQVLSAHRIQIADFLKQLTGEDKKVVVVIFPFVHLIGQDYPAENIHQQMGNFFRENNADVIDLLDYLKGKNAKELMASRFDAHPNEFVHIIAANRLFEKVKKYL